MKLLGQFLKEINLEANFFQIHHFFETICQMQNSEISILPILSKNNGRVQIKLKNVKNSIKRNGVKFKFRISSQLKKNLCSAISLMFMKFQ